MSLIEDLRAKIGADAVLTGSDAAPFSRDWLGKYHWTPVCVVRPSSTQDVSEIMKLASATATPVVPVGGNTGLAGATAGEGAIMISFERMNKVREIRPDGRLAVVEAGVILSDLHDAADAHGLAFPLTFGARGSARVGGFLGTNAGGSNVLRYGNTRDLVLGLEVVLADGRVMDLMSGLHKDNSGLNLKHLVIGAEGTLGIITQAVLKLVPKPGAFATAMIAVRDLDAALGLLHTLQEATSGAVEAFEYMPRRYMEIYHDIHPDAQPILSEMHETNILVEIGATAPRDVTLTADGETPVVGYLEEVLAGLMGQELVTDAVVARNEAQRKQMWAVREAAAEVVLGGNPLVNNDIAVPIDKVATFLDIAGARLAEMDPGAEPVVVSHLGDGNVHYAVWPSIDTPEHLDAVMEMVEDVTLELGGSFSAEHGIGLTKLPSMARRKDKVAIDVMRSIKAALDPQGILNPGKVLPDA